MRHYRTTTVEKKDVAASQASMAAHARAIGATSISGTFQKLSGWDVATGHAAAQLCSAKAEENQVRCTFDALPPTSCGW